MTSDDPAVVTAGQQRDPTTAPGGASYRVRRSYGPSYARAPPPERGGRRAGPRAGAPGAPPRDRHQGAPVTGGEANCAPQSASTPPFPDRKPRRRTRNPSERTRKTTTRLSDTEKAEIAAAATQRGITVARFLAGAGLAAARGSTALHTNEHFDTAIDELASLRTALARIGNNINQIAYVLNAGGRPRPGELDHALSVLLRLLASLDDAANNLVNRRL
ncbi:plasmid mobilization protein [Streptomyces bacillaris]|uniref:plasmid mobilization protein n=1 Tax=Streptomyces bacillaris TaxID=68179 RepID=UPI0038290FC5